MTKTQQQEIEEAVNESDAKGNLEEDHSLSTDTVPQTALAKPFKGVAIEGMEDVPASFEAVPFLRLIQPSSKKTQMADGQEAPFGSFLFNDIQEAFETIDFVLLRAKHSFKNVDEKGNFVDSSYTGPVKQKPQVSILGITTDTDKLFILSLSSTSFSSFGRLISKFKSLHIDKTWRIAVTMSSEKTENDKGKYAFVNFKMGDELTGEQLKAMEAKALEYGVVLDREITPEE